MTILRIKTVCPKCNGEAKPNTTNCCTRCMGDREVDIWIYDVIEYKEQKD